MRPTLFRRRAHVPLGLRAGILIGVVLGLVGAIVGTASGATPFQQIIVVNPPASPVPVAGTVSVGNFPSTQPVSGTVDVAPAIPFSSSCFEVTTAFRVSCLTSDAVPGPVLLRDVSLGAITPTAAGETLEFCFVAQNGTGTNQQAFISLTKEGSDGTHDYYTGNSQVFLHLAKGDKIGATCAQSQSFGDLEMEVFFLGEQTPS